MKEKISRLNIYIKTFLLSLIFSLLLTLALIPLFINGYMEIPLGLLLGAFVNYLFFLIIGLFEKDEPFKQKKASWYVVMISLRLTVFILALVGSALLYYLADIHIFNVIAVAGGYLIPLIIFIVLALLERRKNGSI